MTIEGGEMFGFVGLGIMGYPMASNLVKKGGYKLLVWNRTAEKAQQFVNEHPGCEVAASPMEVAKQCKRVYSMLSTLEASKAVSDATDGLLAGVNPNSEIIDCATLTVDRMVELHASVTAKGGKLMEAPVSGSKGPAIDGTLIFLCGGGHSKDEHKELFESCVPQLQLMGKSWYLMGQIGQGTKAKLVVNVTMGSMLGALAEGLELTDKAGFKLKGPKMVRTDSRTKEQQDKDYATAFPLKHALKDIRFAVDYAKNGDGRAVAMPTAEGAQVMYERALNDGFGDSDFCAVREAAHQA